MSPRCKGSTDAFELMQKLNLNVSKRPNAALHALSRSDSKVASCIMYAKKVLNGAASPFLCSATRAGNRLMIRNANQSKLLWKLGRTHLQLLLAKYIQQALLVYWCPYGTMPLFDILLSSFSWPELRLQTWPAAMPKPITFVSFTIELLGNRKWSSNRTDLVDTCVLNNFRIQMFPSR